MSNDKINSVDVLSLDKHAKVSTVTLTHELGSEINETQLETLEYRRLTYLVPLKRAQDLVLSFFFLTICFFFHMLDRISTKLGQNDQSGEWLQKLSTVWPPRSFRGHRGQKGHFYRKCYSSYILHWILMKLGQKYQWVSGYKSYQHFDLKGHVKVTGVKNVL